MLSTPHRSKVSRICLVALAVFSLAAVCANAAPREFTFEIDRSLLGAELDFVDAREGQATAPTQVAAVIPAASRSTLKDVYQQSSGAAEARPATTRSRGFGSWLKKRWWVPTLAAVVVGVVLAEPFDGKDNPDDPN